MGPGEKPKKVGVVKDRIKLLLVRGAEAVANLILCKGRKGLSRRDLSQVL